MVGSAVFFECCRYQQPVMTSNVILLGSMLPGFLIARMGLLSYRTHVLTAATQRHPYAFPSLWLLTLAVSISAVWFSVATQRSSHRRTAIEATVEAEECATSQGEAYPLRVDTDAGELFSYSGF